MNTGKLYRGVNAEMHLTFGGELRPKEMYPFLKSPEFGLAEYGNAFWGENVQNAVVQHQQHQAGYPTSGVSTTTHYERAKFYATSGGKQPYGFVYVIAIELLEPAGVTAYIVNDIVPMPSVPDDDEVILVAKNFGSLQQEIIVDVLKCCI